MEQNKQYPLVIVFYLDADMMKNPSIIIPFSDSINDMLHKKDANALAFFIPTTGEERVECISVITEDKITNNYETIISDLKTNFLV